MEKSKIINKLIKIFWVFIIGSILGYLLETIVTLIKTGHYESRQGLIYGPFAQVYGIGIVTYYFALSNIKDLKKVFIIAMILGGIVEYMCSFIQEKIFGTVSWDYSHLLFNINGRTSLLYCIYWGIGGILFVKYISPLIEKLNKYIENNNFKIATAVLSIFMIYNITISSMAGYRQYERMNNISANSKLDTMLDKYYPDYKMNKIYANKMRVNK